MNELIERIDFLVGMMGSTPDVEAWQQVKARIATLEDLNGELLARVAEMEVELETARGEIGGFEYLVDERDKTIADLERKLTACEERGRYATTDEFLAGVTTPPMEIGNMALHPAGPTPARSIDAS